ncbi:BadF/BadG/BcrA/BcrD ATPase family protein [Kitasatospora fiedleri]|uniref:BadF/BadG/BcrA/BcrD ATPase family protein n=1 Tax=Kitasatospora fiedleri TaxID=2991545 RepID=UPI00384A4998
MTLRLGLDAGGSHTRAVLTDRTGTVLGRGTAPGANAAGTDPATVTARLAAATAAALGDRAPGRITDCTIGLAGYRALPDPAALAARCRTALRLDVPVRLVPDTVPALASGGVTDGTGTVLIAGTGAICVRLDAGRTVAQHGGLGWLLGDEGGGFWLGRQALRHAHAHPAAPWASWSARTAPTTRSAGPTTGRPAASPNSPPPSAAWPPPATPTPAPSPTRPRTTSPPWSAPPPAPANHWCSPARSPPPRAPSAPGCAAYSPTSPLASPPPTPPPRRPPSARRARRGTPGAEGGDPGRAAPTAGPQCGSATVRRRSGRRRPPGGGRPPRVSRRSGR